MAHRPTRLIYADTGEPVPQADFGYGGAYGTFSLVRFVSLCARESGRTDAEIRVITWYCGATLLKPELVNRTVADIGRGLGFSPDALSRMIRKLVKDRLLRKSGSVGRSPFYEITPYLVFRGSGYEHREALKGWNPPHIKGLTQEPEAYLLVTPAEDDNVEPANFLTHIHSAARTARAARGA
ncbi:helix-turn-helix domain-containing protein [Kitasatospora sp. MBT63]|uniref:MarR family transcriptional regulator n=1 Tax=Kitasatospora sp. MBT63 TaxID=1444768 RepID=UPI00068D953A|nr:helix-turn-helix domain-containing protein [Kitasatospora sp. MBT63]